ncbi:MAG: DUF5107 domain-containing protein [Burkholderiales bacterium]|nr:DUF5107 domain-containing protein [Phycisphaerae bacterium]
MKLRSILILIASAYLLTAVRASGAEPVKLYEELTKIPTYLAGPPDPNPMFYFGSQSQGAEQRIYPYPLYDNLTNKKGEQTYRLIYLENEYVKIAIAPEIGGRLFSAVDKTNNYDYVYRQHVIKPALIGLVGAWISGGIEWNIPHHHRASTFVPVQHRTTENPDGSKTVWVGELEIRHRMRWAIGYTLRPGSNVLECSVRILNRTPLANSMLCFANVAVNANDHYQIIFPPSTQWVTHHSKREFTTWPIATKPYGGVDWDGIDVSWYKNHQSATSMFAWNYSDDFFAGYDHGRQAGTMSVADHHIVPGKKFWTWGNNSRGKMWDNILTDDDGPYIELMVGAYSDNQPDYSYLQPYAARSFEMHWYPFRDIGGVKKANLDAAVNLEVTKGAAHVGFYTTAARSEATVRVTLGDKPLLEEVIAITPAKPYTNLIPVPDGTDPHSVRAALIVDGKELIAYSPIKLAPTTMPAIVKAPPAPSEIGSDEERYLTGLRIDQFHDPEREPEPYWNEILTRDPGNIQAHTGLGRLDLRRARYADAEKHFQAAISRLTARYTTPKDVEPLYYLGVTLKAQGRLDEAFDAFYKATWSQEWKAPAYYALAEIASIRGDYAAALDLVNHSLDANALNVNAYSLKAAMLRHLRRFHEADETLALAARKTDPLDVRLMAERWLMLNQNAFGNRRLYPDELLSTFAAHPATAQEIAAELANAGLWKDATDLLGVAIEQAAPNRLPALIYYYAADFYEKQGDADAAAKHRQFAEQQPAQYGFPFQAEAIPVLRRAMEANPKDARAPYYLGNLLFDWQPAEATRLWEIAASLDPKFPIVWRNLAQAYAHEPGEPSRGKAIEAMEKAVAVAVAVGEPDPMHLSELDQLYEAAGAPVEKRLEMLERHQSGALKKDEARLKLIDLKTFVGKSDESIALLSERTFSIWETGSKLNTGESWADAHFCQGLKRLDAKQYAEALLDFEAARKFPENLRAGERSTSPARERELVYWIGCTQEAMGNAEAATQSWKTAAAEPTTVPGGRRGGNSALIRGVQQYYRGLASQKLGQTDGVSAIFEELVKSADAAVAAAATQPTTAPADRQSIRTRSATAHYLAGLGHLGLGDKDKARAALTAALEVSPDHLAAKVALSRL